MRSWRQTYRHKHEQSKITNDPSLAPRRSPGADKVGRRRLYVGAWQHGISIYGWQQGRDGGFTDRHPELLTGKATIRLRPQDAAAIADDEILGLVGAALEP